MSGVNLSVYTIASSVIQGRIRGREREKKGERNIHTFFPLTSQTLTERKREGEGEREGERERERILKKRRTHTTLEV